MTSQKWLRLCYGGLALYVILTIAFYIFGDKEHGLMFLCGSGVWAIACLIWGRNVNNGL